MASFIRMENGKANLFIRLQRKLRELLHRPHQSFQAQSPPSKRMNDKSIFGKGERSRGSLYENRRIDPQCTINASGRKDLLGSSPTVFALTYPLIDPSIPIPDSWLHSRQRRVSFDFINATNRADATLPTPGKVRSKWGHPGCTANKVGTREENMHSRLNFHTMVLLK